MPEKNMSVNGDFGRLLKSLRIRSDTAWAQKSLAEALRNAGCKASLRTYKGWEEGEGIPPPEVLRHIVALLGLSREDEDTLYRAAAQPPPEVGIHNFPHPRNPFFTGRQTYLEQLRQFLQENSSIVLTQPISISGLGGIGKTQLALEYAYQSYPDIYRTVLWVNAADRETLESSYDSLAQTLKLPERDERELKQRIRAVKRWLSEHTNWLLIMDNADNLQLARSFFPEVKHGHILLTTRSHFAGGVGAKLLEVNRMEPEEGLFFLLRRSGTLAVEASTDTVPADIREPARELAELLDGHPLALDQAGAYIEETSVTFTEYINLYQKKRSALLGKRRAHEDDHPEYSEHPESVVASFELCLASLEKTRERHPSALYVLYLCAFFYPDDILVELLQVKEVGLETAKLNVSVAALQRYSLIRRNEQKKALSMHRLLRAVLIDIIDPDIRKMLKDNVVYALNAIFPRATVVEWNQHMRLVPHALICATWSEDELVPTLGVAELFHKAGECLLYGLGHYTEAETLLSRALSILVQQLGTEHPETTVVLNDLAKLYMWQGKDNQAESLYLKTLAIQDMPLEAQHPATAMGLRRLSYIYLKQGKHKQATSLLERACSIQESYLGAQHHETARSQAMLAVLCYVQGEYSRAHSLYWQAIHVWDRHNCDERDIDRLLDGLSLLDHEQVQYERAIRLFERTYDAQIWSRESEMAIVEVLGNRLEQILHKKHDADGAAPKANDEPPA